MKKYILLFSILLTCMAVARAQEQMDLYDGPVPGSKPAENLETNERQEVYHKISEPQLIAYPAPREKANGTAVIICPGGGYVDLWMVHEGSSVARRLNELGVSAFVLKYRMPEDRTMEQKSFGPLQDAQRAIQIVRQQAGRWNIDPDKVGIMGFSAGGHLASTAGTHFDTAIVANPENVNLRPDFMILVYPVITMQDPLTHKGSQKALLGSEPSAAMKDYFSNDQQVTSQTPPTFLVQSTDDVTVPVENSILFYQALREHQVSAAMHLFDVGGHGFPKEPAKSHWFDYAADWLRFKGWIPK